jgi:flagellar biosynthetic protein FliQ
VPIMGFDMNVEFLRMAFWQIVMVAGPVLLVALAIGLFIGIIQAATSINEQTLSFVPKLVVVLITFGLLANLMMVQLSDYFHFIFEQVAQVG